MSKEDMPKVIAGVFINRLDKGMNLGSDVTVCYAQPEDSTGTHSVGAEYRFKVQYEKSTRDFRLGTYMLP